MKIVTLDEGLITIKLRDYQKEMLNLLDNNRNCIFKNSRQNGKTILVTTSILHYILFTEYKTVALLANKGAAAREIMSRLQLAYEHHPHWLQQGVVEWNRGYIEVESGSKCFASATSGTAVRGRSIDSLVIDECAFISNWDEFYASVYSTVSSGKNSKITLISTVNKMNHFYHIWMDSVEGKNTFANYEVQWDQVPGRDEAWKAKTIADTSEDQFRQEHENCFLGAANGLIGSKYLLGLRSIEAEVSLENSLKIYKQPMKGHTYVMPVDTARGKGLDKSAFSVIDVSVEPFEQVCTFYNSEISPFDYPKVITTIGEMYNTAYLLIETNDMGEAIVDTCHMDIEYENIIGNPLKKYELGIRTTKSVKFLGCQTLRALVEKGKIKLVDESTITELTGFISNGISYEADVGYHDDLVMGLVLFAWLTTSDEFLNIVGEYSSHEMLSEDEYIRELEENLMPFGFIDDGLTPETIVEDGNTWLTSTL
ncbi:MAG: terminase family protein [Ghiorsea sp.]